MLLDVIPSQLRLVLTMLSIMKRYVLTVDDPPLYHSFHVKIALYTVVIVTSPIVLPEMHIALAAVEVKVSVIATTLAGKSCTTLCSKDEAGVQLNHQLHLLVTSDASCCVILQPAMDHSTLGLFYT